MIKAVSLAGKLKGYESNYKYMAISWIEAEGNRAAFALVGSNSVSDEDSKKENIVFEGEVIKHSGMIKWFQFDLYLQEGLLHREKKMALIDRRDGRGLYAEKGLFKPALIDAERIARKCLKEGKCDVSPYAAPLLVMELPSPLIR